MTTWMQVLSAATRLLAVVLIVLSIVPAVTATKARAADESAVTSVVESDPGVIAARNERERLAGERDAINQLLDEAAAEYEHARGQAERLTTESEQEGRELHAVEESINVGREQTTDRAVAAYLTPSRQLSLAQLVLGAEDPRSAMHLAGVIDHIGHRSNTALGEFDDLEALRRDETRQQYVVTAGARTVADERLRAAGQLQTALYEAARIVETAEQTVDTVERDVAERERQRLERERLRRERERQRLEAERKAREEAIRLGQIRQQEDDAYQASAWSGPPPPVDGLFCPVGTPNGFIDSWGFPRSGGRTHKGIDMFASYGTGLFAVADGVVRTGSNRLGGLTIWLTDTGGSRYYYAHLASIDVGDGARVTAGQQIGTTGNSGNARGTPPHLHWQYHPGGGAAVNSYPLATALCR